MGDIKGWFQQMHHYLLTAVLLLNGINISSAAANNGRKHSVAVIDLIARGEASRREAAELTQWLRVLLVKSGIARILPVDEMQQKLSGLSLREDACRSRACIRAWGDKLGVDYFLAGALGQVGSTRALLLELFDTRQGKSVYTFSLSFAPGRTAALAAGAEAISSFLSRMPHSQQNFGKTGGAKILTSPVNAEVYIENLHAGTAPLTLLHLPPGLYAVALFTDEFIDLHAQVEIKPDTVIVYQANLGRLINLRISSERDSAYIYVDGRFLGLAPVEKKITAGSEVTVTARNREGKVWERRMLLQEDTQIRVSFMEPMPRWIWIGGGFAVTGTLGYLLFKPKPGNSSGKSAGFPVPPGRP